MEDGESMGYTVGRHREHKRITWGHRKIVVRVGPVCEACEQIGDVVEDRCIKGIGVRHGENMGEYGGMCRASGEQHTRHGGGGSAQWASDSTPIPNPNDRYHAIMDVTCMKACRGVPQQM